MSVFSDFQRMWVQRFPQSTLSDAWEQDVRASLHRHKQKIADLSKEIEQEKLYVGYLERLLSDVEQFRESGGDPSALFDAANPTVTGLSNEVTAAESDKDGVGAKENSFNLPTMTYQSNEFDNTKIISIMQNEKAIIEHEHDIDELATATSPCKRFIKYDVIIGSGSFKTVYRGLDTETGVTVAWCELIDKKVTKAERQRFREEADLLKNLQHPNIVSFYTFWESTIDKRKNIVLVTELMYSGTLKSYLQRFGKKLNPKVVKSYSRQILKGLSFLHSRTPPIIHRDLKCDNIFVAGNTGSIKIGDLGLAKLKNRSYVKSVIGTPEFMAPEMYKEEYDEAVDIYAFGMCIVEMITLKYPFSECTTTGHIYKKVINGIKPDAFYEIENSDLKEIVEKCIELKAENRPSAKELLCSELLAEDCGIKLDIMSKDEFLMNANFNIIRFQLRLSPKKMRHKQNEAIQFDFDITLDNAPDVANDLFLGNFVSESDARIVSELLKNQVQTMIKMRRQLLLDQTPLETILQTKEKLKENCIVEPKPRPNHLILNAKHQSSKHTIQLQHDLQNILQTRSVAKMSIPQSGSQPTSPLKNVPVSYQQKQQELEQQLAQVLHVTSTTTPIQKPTVSATIQTQSQTCKTLLNESVETNVIIQQLNEFPFYYDSPTKKRNLSRFDVRPVNPIANGVNTLIASGPDPSVIKSIEDSSNTSIGTSSAASSTTSAANGLCQSDTSKDGLTTTDSESELKLMKLKKDGALNQCINELSSNLRSVSETAIATKLIDMDNVKNDNNSSSANLIHDTTAPSHFVTVIEVKESMSSSNESILNDSGKGSDGDFDKDEKEKFCEKDLDTITTTSTSTNVKEKSASSQVLAAVLEAKKKVPPRPPPKFIRRAAPVDPPIVPTNANTTTSSPLSSSSSSSPGAAAAAATINKDNDSPSNSLERNLKPSEFLRQKSSESLDVKLATNYRKTTPEICKYSMGLADEFGRRAVVAKAESLEKSTKRPDKVIKRAQSPTASLGKESPTGSLSKFGTTRSTDSPTDSLGIVSHRATESIGSKESLASQGHISERIKSYESISSLSSDSIKVGQNIEHEPYYDTVALDNGDGDYVYIQAGGNGSTSSRDDISNAGSTLPMPANPKNFNSQSSIITEPESPGRSSNYVNIDYFLSQDARSSSFESDGETEPPHLMRGISQEYHPSTPGAVRKLSSDRDRSTLIRHIITSIINSETLYVECLNKLMQYMKAIRATLTTSQPVITEEEFQTIFFKIDELYTVHTKFLNSLRAKVAQDGEIFVGEIFKELAGHINLYGAFLHNYGRAIDTVKKCGSNNHQFRDIVSKIVLNSQNEQSLSLEDLLHKPVARVQKNALVLEDLLNGIPQNHPDVQPLKQAQKMIRSFLSEFNVVQTKNMYPFEDKALRRLVKHSFIVELADGNRKFRHLFLYNDAIACAKYKSTVRDEFELKWFIPLKDICILEEPSPDPKENNPVNILHLKSQACTIRDQIMLEEKEDKKSKALSSRTNDKHRKKLHDLEIQLVLATPNLIFRISNKSTGKIMIFFLSSDFERTQWIDSIVSLQQSCNLPGAQQISIYDIQAWIQASPQILTKSNLYSYLSRNNRNVVGDLCFTIQGLTGIEKPADFFICVEVDFYGHYFRKAKTKLICRSTSPLWNESFILELEGSQNVRILLYEDHSPRQILRGQHVLKLTRQLLKESLTNMPLKLSDTIVLNTTLRFIPGEVSLRRVPISKPGALFGAKMQQVLKREKRDIPFIITACIREVERRGMYEVGIYRVSGSASDLAKLKKSFETNNYEAEQLLKDVDIHSVTGILKSYLRELPEALFTDLLYPKLFDTFNRYSNFNEATRIEALQKLFIELPQPNQASISYILEHLIRVHQQEAENKMSLHNLAMVFGPTLLRPGPQSAKQKDLLESSTVDVMAQAGILYCFLLAKLK